MHVLRRWALPGFDGTVFVHGMRSGQVQLGDVPDFGVHGFLRVRKVFVGRSEPLRILQSWVLRFVDVIFSLRRLRNWPVPVRHGLHELHGVRRWDL